jgi:two-component system response regulator YesN
MTKLLIVEDEPLVQVGIRSMISGTDLDVEICGIAKDGVQALELIDKYTPKIIITDIKMPRMNGLELMKTCREKYGKLPAFIVLTSYEEFNFLKEAMKYQVIEYLIKLELNQESLSSALGKALQSIEEIEAISPTIKASSMVATQPFYDKFFIKLLLNLFENEKDINLQANELNLDFSAHSYIVSHCEIEEYTPMWKTPDKNRLLSLYSSTIQMIREIARKFLPCYVTSLDTKHFSIIFCLDEDQRVNYKELILDVLQKTYSMIHNYFNVTILTSIGSPCNNQLYISEAYQDARQIFSSVTKEKPILFYDDFHIDKTAKNIFNMSLFRGDIKKAFEEFDTDTLTLIFNQITDIFRNHNARYLKSIDAASNILYLAISLLPEGEETVARIFQDDPDGYRSLYRQTNVDQVVEWLLLFRDGLCDVLNEQKKNYKNHIVINVKKYIDSHIDEKLNLNDVSSVFGISPNYLSQLFKKFNEIGFTDYINQMKIAKAKELMTESTLKIYEIADQLGFESSFYFSKVFKKVEGCSPRDYIQGKIIF